VFLASEHELHQVIRGRRDFMPNDDAPDSEDEDDKKDDVVDEEADIEMEDVPPATVKLEVVLPDNYDDDAATAATMAAPLEDDANFV
jgi:hypothetical protein